LSEGEPMGTASSGGNKRERPPEDVALERERSALLRRLEASLETPMLVLAFVWLVLLVAELIWGERVAFELIGMVIWAIFIVDFSVELMLAPHRGAYLRANWLAAVSLLVPALRIFRVFRMLKLIRVARVGRSLRLLRLVSALNRGMGALGASLRRRGFGYVLSLTVLVNFAGAAGMYSFESGGGAGLNSYGEALWWTAMVLTTMGSQYWPQTLEGRVLCFFLALYAFAVFGYVTATLATFFVGRDAENQHADAPAGKEHAEIREELAALRREVREILLQQRESVRRDRDRQR